MCCEDIPITGWGHPEKPPNTTGKKKTLWYIWENLKKKMDFLQTNEDHTDIRLLISSTDSRWISKQNIQRENRSSLLRILSSSQEVIKSEDNMKIKTYNDIHKLDDWLQTFSGEQDALEWRSIHDGQIRPPPGSVCSVGEEWILHFKMTERKSEDEWKFLTHGNGMECKCQCP